MKVLVADDDPVWRKLLARRLEQWGYEVVTAEDGEQAWRALQAHHGPRIAIIDWQMPVVDGLSICSRLKRSLKVTFTYIIMLTGRDAKEDTILGLRAGADEYLTKPVDMEILRSRMGVARRIVESIPPPEWSLPKAPGYEVHRLIGRGAAGTVWKATHLESNRSVALKIIRMDLVTREEHQRFLREIEVTRSLEHPNIARVYESRIDEKQCYYAMELIEGSDLRDHVLRHKPSQGQIIDIMARVCDGVGCAHLNGVTHRDLKPQNILITYDGIPKVVDFGIAKLARLEANAEDVETLQGVALGTPMYMAPEQAGRRPDLADPRTDVYALGVILYALLVRKHPHKLKGLSASEVMSSVANTPVRRPTEFIPDFSRTWERVLLKALAKDPDSRYPSAVEFGAALVKCAADEQ
jgi:serine/threonine protein kinase